MNDRLPGHARVLGTSHVTTLVVSGRW